MTKEQIEKLIKVGEQKKFDAIQLAKYATQSPYSLTPADATIVMDAYKRKHPETRPFFEPSTAMKLEANPIVSAKRTLRTWKKLLKPGKFPATLDEAERQIETSNLPRTLNRSAVKDYAMLVSVSKRAGKFRRVSKSFVVGVEAEVDAALRAIGGNPNTESADIPGTWDFLNRKQIRPKVEEQMNILVKKTIFARVMRHPSMGKTLK